MSPHKDNSPKCWRAEASGVLAPVVGRYLLGEQLSLMDIATMRAYLRQWIWSPVWDIPAHDDSTRAELADLRSRLEGIRTRRSLDEWIALAAEFGIDPL
jgi:hypothetical protein